MRKRPRCERCARPVAYCLCAQIPQLASQTKVLILQHHSEQSHALNTARLAYLGLCNAELWVGEHFETLATYLAQQALHYRPVLLYPNDSAQVLLPYGVEHPLQQQAETISNEVPGAAAEKPYLLVVPDGTWKKARKLIYLNSSLAQLPTVTLAAPPASEYRLRAAKEANALSTIEAITVALNTLEQPQRFDALLRPFNCLIEQQISAMGEQRYQQNYLQAKNSSR